MRLLCKDSDLSRLEITTDRACYKTLNIEEEDRSWVSRSRF